MQYIICLVHAGVHTLIQEWNPYVCINIMISSSHLILFFDQFGILVIVPSFFVSSYGTTLYIIKTTY